MRKAVAIPYVIALILGVVVVGILGYWFVAQGGKTVGVGTTAECDSLCVLWRNSGFNVKPAGIDKCPNNLRDSGVCAYKLGCTFITGSKCNDDERDFGTTTFPPSSEIKRVCCKS